MKRQQIAEEVAKRQQHIENAQDWIQRLQQMTPDEDKPVVKSWYIVHEKDGEVFVTQWLNANNVSEAMDMCGEECIAFIAPVGGVKVTHASNPF